MAQYTDKENVEIAQQEYENHNIWQIYISTQI